MHGLRPYRRKRRRRRMQESLGPSLPGQAAGDENNLLLATLNVINQVPCTCITLRERRSRQARLANMGGSDRRCGRDADSAGPDLVLQACYGSGERRRAA
jgi:hypothetical protein